MKDDPLNDLEDFIDSDWQKVFQKFKDEEYKKEIEEPVTPNIPNYGEFYQELVELVTQEHIPPRLAHLVHRVISYQDRKLTSSFEHIWSLFCDPSRYKVEEVHCDRCGHPQTIVFSRASMPVFQRRSMWNEPVDHHITQEMVRCIKCGEAFRYVAGKIVGVFDNRRIE